MNTHTTDALAQFCSEQYFSFDPQKWTVQNHYDINALKVLARYLSQTSWYGHEEDLEHLFGQAADRCSVSVTKEDSKTFVDLAYFSVTVRCRIAALQGMRPKFCAEELNKEGRRRVKNGGNALTSSLHSSDHTKVLETR